MNSLVSRNYDSSQSPLMPQSSISVQTDLGCDVIDSGITSPGGYSSVSDDSNEDKIERDKLGLLRHSGELPMERSVEGKADSDEESMKDWPMKSTESNNDQTVQQLRERVFETEAKSKSIEQNFKEMESDLLTELDRRLQEMENTNQELQKLKTEQVRQNIIESTTLSQIIQILRGIRRLGLARRIVGKMTLDTVDLCPASDPPDEEADVRNFVHLFHKQLQSVEFLPEIKETVTTSPAQVLSTRRIVKTSPVLSNKTTPTKSVQIHTNFYTFSPKKQRSVEV